MTKACRQCGVEFGPGRWPQNWKKRIFCGDACMRASKRFTDEQVLEIMRSKIDTAGPNGCWLWTGKSHIRNYGTVSWRGEKKYLVHRLLYQFAHGNISGSRVHCLHRCDNPRCVNPAHIFLGDAAANHADMVAKGRHTRGELTRRNKLTEKQVLEILANPPKFGRGVTEVPEYADRYGVSHGAIQAVVAGRSWSHLRKSAPPDDTANSTKGPK